MTIAIISDTDTSLPQESLDKYDIRQVSITIHFGDEILKACSDIIDKDLVERVNRDGVLPTTAAPSPGDFSGTYQEAFDQGADEIICLTVSAGVSATYQSALTAAELFPGKKITVVDTETISMGQGFMVLKAAELARAGKNTQDILAEVRKVRERTHLFGALDTLKFMAMSGRVGSLSAEMAALMSIKPILTIKDGKLELLEKVRTRKKAWARIHDLTVEHLDGGEFESIFILHVAASQAADEFEQLLREVVPCPVYIPKTELTPGLSVHTGGGFVGVAFTTKP
jgi:DegV family protein with EDD domain